MDRSTVAVQIVNRTGHTVSGIEQIGSAHTDAEFGVILAKAEQELRPEHQAFDFGDVEHIPVRTNDVADEASLIGPRNPRQPQPGASAPQAKSSLRRQ